MMNVYFTTLEHILTVRLYKALGASKKMSQLWFKIPS